MFTQDFTATSSNRKVTSVFSVDFTPHSMKWLKGPLQVEEKLEEHRVGSYKREEVVSLVAKNRAILTTFFEPLFKQYDSAGSNRAKQRNRCLHEATRVPER